MWKLYISVTQAPYSQAVQHTRSFWFRGLEISTCLLPGYWIFFFSVNRINRRTTIYFKYSPFSDKNNLLLGKLYILGPIYVQHNESEQYPLWVHLLRCHMHIQCSVSSIPFHSFESKCKLFHISKFESIFSVFTSKIESFLLNFLLCDGN